jgi:hypothetical protein
LKARIGVGNITDITYQLRQGGGGVNAPHYGMRRGIFGSLGYVFYGLEEEPRGRWSLGIAA